MLQASSNFTVHRVFCGARESGMVAALNKSPCSVLFNTGSCVVKSGPPPGVHWYGRAVAVFQVAIVGQVVHVHVAWHGRPGESHECARHRPHRGPTAMATRRKAQTGISMVRAGTPSPFWHLYKKRQMHKRGAILKNGILQDCTPQRAARASRIDAARFLQRAAHQISFQSCWLIS